MSSLYAFLPQTPTIAVTTSGTINTAVSQEIDFPGTGTVATNKTNSPPQCRVVNTGTAIVFLSITSTATVATVPTNTVYSGAKPILPNSIEVLSVPQTTALFVNTISGTASQTLYLTFGEGL